MKSIQISALFGSLVLMVAAAGCQPKDMQALVYCGHFSTKNQELLKSLSGSKVEYQFQYQLKGKLMNSQDSVDPSQFKTSIMGSQACLEVPIMGNLWTGETYEAEDINIRMVTATVTINGKKMLVSEHHRKTVIDEENHVLNVDGDYDLDATPEVDEEKTIIDNVRALVGEDVISLVRGAISGRKSNPRPEAVESSSVPLAPAASGAL